MRVLQVLPRMPAKSNASVTSSTANASQTNESVICARVAGTKFAGVTGEENLFLLPWKLIFTTVENLFSSRGNFLFYLFNKF